MPEKAKKKIRWIFSFFDRRWLNFHPPTFLFFQEHAIIAFVGWMLWEVRKYGNIDTSHDILRSPWLHSRNKKNFNEKVEVAAGWTGKKQHFFSSFRRFTSFLMLSCVTLNKIIFVMNAKRTSTAAKWAGMGKILLKFLPRRWIYCTLSIEDLQLKFISTLNFLLIYFSLCKWLACML